MALAIGGNQINKAYLGTTEIQKMYLGADLVFDNSIQPSELTPIMTNFRVEDATPTQVHFDTPLGPVTGMTTAGFEITGNTILAVNTVNNYFTVQDEIDSWDNHSIRLGENSDTSDRQTVLHNFTLSNVENKIDEPTATTNRYVAVGGSGDGTSEGNAASLTTMATDAVAGQTWWIKAGDYGDTRITLGNSGTVDNPIKYIGYKNTIGDVVDNYFDYGVAMSSDEMPTLTGPGPASLDYNDIAISITGNYFILRNIQTYGYGRSLYAGAGYSNHFVIDRFNIEDNYSATDANPSGMHLVVGSGGHQYFRILDSTIINCSMAGIAISGPDAKHILIEGIKSYCDQVGTYERQDYHISVKGDENVIRDCYAENFNNTSTSGSTHGIGILAGSTGSANYNLIEDSIAINFNETFYVRNSLVEYNVIKNCVSGNNGNTAENDTTGGLYIFGEANYTTFENCKVVGVGTGIQVIDKNTEDGNSSRDIGTGNKFINCIFDNIYGRGLDLIGNTEGGSPDSIMANTQLINCTWNNINYFIANNSTYTVDIQGMYFINNILNDVENDVLYSALLSDLDFSNCTIFNCDAGFTPIIGNNGNIDENPQLDANFLPSNENIMVGTTAFGGEYDYNKKEREVPETTIGAVTLTSEDAGGVIPPVTDIDYYVSFTDGLDSNDGLTEQTSWKTLYHIYEERASITPGKVVALKKGDVWNERLLLSSSMNGTLGNEIVITSYGSGNKPKISQTESISTWADQGNNIWRADVSGTTIYHVLKDDELQTNARFPIITSDFATEDNYSNIDTLTDQTHLIVSDFSGFGTDALIGANVYILTSEWILEQGTITAYNTLTGAITVSGFTGTISAGEEIFVNNNINLLATQNDWHYDSVGEDLYIYSTTSPTNITAITQTTDGCAANSGYVTLDGLEFSGLYGRGVTSESNTGITIQNCSFKNIWNFAVNGYNSIGFTVIDNTFDNSTTRDVTASGTSSGMVVERNTIRNSGLLSQLSYLGYNDGNNKCIAVQVDATIRNNDIENVAYVGIFTSNPAIIEENYIKSTCLAMQDGGAIYTTGTGAGVSGTQINNNICIANPTASDSWNSFGIYLDESSEGVTVGENTTTGFKRDIFLHKSKDNIITYNSMYKAKSLGFTTSEKATGFPVENNAINDNDIYLEVVGGYALNIYSETNSYTIGTLNNNNYWNPSNTDDVHVKTTEPRDEGLTLVEWVALSGQDSTSTSDLGTTVADSQLVYNATNSQDVQPLTGTWADLSGNIYAGSITLEAWRSKILVQYLGNEMISDPGFSKGDWALGTGATIVNDQLVLNQPPNFSWCAVIETPLTETAKNYHITFNVISYTQGQIRCGFDGATNTYSDYVTPTSGGTVVQQLVSGTDPTHFLLQVLDDFIGTIDNVSVVEIV